MVDLHEPGSYPQMLARVLTIRILRCIHIVHIKVEPGALISLRAPSQNPGGSNHEYRSYPPNRRP